DHDQQLDEGEAALTQCHCHVALTCALPHSIVSWTLKVSAFHAHCAITTTRLDFGSISNFLFGGGCGTGCTYPAATTSEKVFGMRRFSNEYFRKAWVRSASVFSTFPGSLRTIGMTGALAGRGIVAKTAGELGSAAA